MSQFPVWSNIPFLLIIALIAAGPMFFPHFWHQRYKLISVLIGLFSIVFIAVGGYNPILLAETTSEYLSFILLLAALFVISSGIYIHADVEVRPWVNLLVLLTGGVLANFIGTTGASILLIRPFIRLNKYRMKPYLIVFFIFIVSNVGGLLTPLGDPPLFIGFLKGVPFFWTLQHLWLPWITAMALLGAIFYFIDSRNVDKELRERIHESNRFVFMGKRNLIGLLLVIGTLFLDPHVITSLPSIHLGEHHFSFIRELLLLLLILVFYWKADKSALQSNHFTTEPIQEVAFLFFGIFFSMIPALATVQEALKNPDIANRLTIDTAYWTTGILSSFLDNAPTYLNLFTAALAKHGYSVNSYAQVQEFLAQADQVPAHRLFTEAISIAAVFFGAMTYIGNGPNFMVKSIAEGLGIETPSFFRYILRYSLPILLPVYLLIWWLFL